MQLIFFVCRRFSVFIIVFLTILVFGLLEVCSAVESSEIYENDDTAVENFDRHIDSHLLHRIRGLQLMEDLRVGMGITFVFQAAHNANGDTLSQVGDDVDDRSYSIDLEVEKTFSDYGKLFSAIEILGGKGVEDELKVFSNVNYDADTNGRVRLAEAWYEHYFKSLPFTLTMGKLNATNYIDTNEYANDEIAQFLGRIFRSSPTVEFGDNAAGIRLALELSDFIDIEVVVMDANSDWNDLFAEQFFAGQINFKPRLFQRDGNYRLVGWFNRTDHTKWNDASKTSEDGFGVGISLDQQLTDNLGAFFRYSWQDPEVYLNTNDFSLEYAVSAGVQLSGDIWGRDEDVLGFAYGLIFPSDDYKDSGSFAAKSEGHLELYYNYRVNDYLTLSPDVQVIWRPFGRDAANGNEAITIFGIRGQLIF